MNKVTKESIEAKIKKVDFRQLTDKITHCVITMLNGFQVTGESACVDPKNYDRKIGEQIAQENAFEKLWELEGYLLQEKLFGEKQKASSISKSVFQKPMVPEECQMNFDNPAIEKVLSPGTSYEHKVEQKACNCMDWDTFPQAKKLMFDQMFPDAPNFAFDLCTGKIKIEGKMPPDGLEIKAICISKIEDKFLLFHAMFPGATFQDFEALESLVKKDSEPDAEQPGADYFIRLTKQYRKDLDATLQSIKNSRRQSKERSLAITKIQEGIMWLGMDLKELGSANPYPTSYNPATAKVEPTADGLKL